MLYGCETWYLTVREECRLRVFENRILRRIFGPKKNEKEPHEEFHSLYRSPNIVKVTQRRLRQAGHGRRKECFQNFNRLTYRKETFRQALGVDGRIILKWILKK